MKKILLILLAFPLLFSCRKDDNPRLPELVRVPTPILTKDAGTDAVISAQDPATFSGKFTVDLYQKTDAPPEKMDIVIMKNGNASTQKVLKANVTTWPTTITITGPELATLFGEPVILGDKFDIGANMVVGGRTFEAFPNVPNGVANGSGVVNQPGASTFIRYEAVCKYDPAIYNGNFVVVTDEWADYAAGDIVPVTQIDDTHFSFMYPADNAQPIIITVNPTTNQVSVAKQVYGSGYGASWPYGPLSVESVPGVDNFVAPCDRIVSVVLKHTVAAGTFGTFKIVLKKQ